MAEANYSKVDKEIETINRKLAAGFGKVSMRRRGKSLYIRATFPPKSGETAPKQRDLPLGLKATPNSMRIALEKAIEISNNLALNRFDWATVLGTTDIQQSAFSDPVTVAEFIDLQRAKYFKTREENPDTQTNWLKDYGYVYRKLPADKPLSIDLLCDAILEIPVTQAKARHRAAMAYSQLAELAGFNPAPIKDLKGKYDNTGTGEMSELPTLETVIEWYYKMPPDIQFEYAIRAAYGLRPGEGGRWCKFDNLKSERELGIYSTKTSEWRIAYPYPKELFNIFELGTREPVLSLQGQFQ